MKKIDQIKNNLQKKHQVPMQLKVVALAAVHHCEQDL